MILLDNQAARGLLDTLALLLLATALGSVLVRRLEHSIRLLAAQGVLLAAAAAVVALATGTTHALIAAALTLAVKVVVVPGILLFAQREVRVTK